MHSFKEFWDTLNLSFRRIDNCLDVFSIMVFMWFDLYRLSLILYPSTYKKKISWHFTG
jgi:hypothetical protein